MAVTSDPWLRRYRYMDGNLAEVLRGAVAMGGDQLGIAS